MLFILNAEKQATMTSVLRKEPTTAEFRFSDWTVTASESHILCSEGPERQKFESELKLPNLPEMVFASNSLSVTHDSGFGVTFNALDALRLVDAEHDLMKVAVAQEWQEARADCEHIKDTAHPFDWTFTTNYQGTLFGSGGSQMMVVPTTEKIDVEKLKVREKIHFYADILLFEDELSDNGCSMLRVKIRVMPNLLFLLLRFYLRVDGVLVRTNDTRYFLEAGMDHMLREFCSKESHIPDLRVPLHILTDPNVMGEHLTTTSETTEKLLFPRVAAKQEESQIETVTSTSQDACDVSPDLSNDTGVCDTTS
ncbi:TIP41-like protein [Lamellibrachia satsuma]|nr:TIP41-like protein [Lamellibrachia satsuma]